MKLHTLYHIIINDIIVYTSSNYTKVVDELKAIRKTEPKAYVQPCYF